MKHVLAARTRAANQQRAASGSLKAQKEQQNVDYLNRQRQETAIRRQAQHQSANANHLGSKLANYSKAVTQANMRKSADRMQRVNRYPNPNPGGLQPEERVGGAAAAAAAANGGKGGGKSGKGGKRGDGRAAPEDGMDDNLGAVVPRAEPNIWGKMYAYDQHVADQKDADKKEKERKGKYALAAELAKQVAIKDGKAAKAVAHEEKYAASEARQRASWKVEEAKEAATRQVFDAAEKKMFSDAKALVDQRRAQERRADVEQETREVARIKRGQRAAEKRAVREKVKQKQTLDRFQAERVADDKVQLVVQEKRRKEELNSNKDAMRMMDQMDAERQARIDEQNSHQAYLYGKGESTQDRIAKELKEAEAKMLQQFKENNRLEDEKHAAREKKAHDLVMWQKESIDEQLKLQAAGRRRDAELEFRLAHQAKVSDERAAYEMMYKEVGKRQVQLAFKDRLLQQRAEERMRKRNAKMTMTALEERLNGDRIRKAEDFWAKKMAADEKNPPPPLPACIGVADLGMR